MKILTINNEILTWEELVLLLARASKGQILDEVVITGCNFTNLPTDFFWMSRIKYRGRWLNLICGFPTEHFLITNNIFETTK